MPNNNNKHYIIDDSMGQPIYAGDLVVCVSKAYHRLHYGIALYRTKWTIRIYRLFKDYEENVKSYWFKLGDETPQFLKLTPDQVPLALQNEYDKMFEKLKEQYGSELRPRSD